MEVIYKDHGTWRGYSSYIIERDNVSIEVLFKKENKAIFSLVTEYVTEAELLFDFPCKDCLEFLRFSLNHPDIEVISHTPDRPLI